MKLTDCLSIDPGPETCGVLLISGGKVLEATQDATVVTASNAIRVWSLLPVLIEGLSNYGQQIGDSTLRTAYAIGKLASVAPDRTTVIRRTDVKQALLGTATGNDSIIRQNILERFGGPDAAKKGGALSAVKGHAWQALAMACAWEVMRANGGVKAVRMP